MPPAPVRCDRVLGALAGLALALHGSAMAASVAAGRSLAEKGLSASSVPPCSACHGPKGAGTASLGPRLAGLSAPYIQRELAAFRSGERFNPLMKPVATALTGEQSADVAAYFSQVVDAPSAPSTAASDLIEAGRSLAQEGRWSAGLPACADCHAPGGVGVAPSFPYLAGQSAGYLESRLKAWRSGQAKDDPLALMRSVSAKLTDHDVSAVSAYYASLPAPRRQGGNP